eukprot:scaffold38277_cov36-Prasinocladus_malaysianus.AAC.2
MHPQADGVANHQRQEQGRPKHREEHRIRRRLRVEQLTPRHPLPVGLRGGPAAQEEHKRVESQGPPAH